MSQPGRNATTFFAAPDFCRVELNYSDGDEAAHVLVRMGASEVARVVGEAIKNAQQFVSLPSATGFRFEAQVPGDPGSGNASWNAGPDVFIRASSVSVVSPVRGRRVTS